MSKTPSTIIRILTDWKVLCSAIIATIPIGLFVFSQFQWRANLVAEQKFQNDAIAQLKDDAKKHVVDDDVIKNGIQKTNNEINNKLGILATDVADIKGQLKILVPKIEKTGAITANQ